VLEVEPISDRNILETEKLRDHYLENHAQHSKVYYCVLNVNRNSYSCLSFTVVVLVGTARVLASQAEAIVDR